MKRSTAIVIRNENRLPRSELPRMYSTPANIKRTGQNLKITFQTSHDKIPRLLKRSKIPQSIKIIGQVIFFA